MTHPWDEHAELVQRQALERALVSERGNITRAAAALDLSRSHVMRLIKKYDLVAGAGELRGQKTGRPRTRDRHGGGKTGAL